MMDPAVTCCLQVWKMAVKPPANPAKASRKQSQGPAA